MTYSAKTDWTSANGVAASDLNRIEQGIADITDAYTPTDVLNKIKTVDGTGSGLDADLFDGLNSDSFLFDRGGMSSTINWNIITNPGIYFFGNVSGMTNAPSIGDYGVLEVYSNAISGYIIQRVTCVTTNKTAYRRRTETSSDWSAWIEVITSAGGQTINGPLKISQTGNPIDLHLDQEASTIVQMLFGRTNGAHVSLGTSYSSGSAVITHNAYQDQDGADHWTQGSASFKSMQIRLEINDGFYYYEAPAGKAAGTSSAFWGTGYKIWDASKIRFTNGYPEWNNSGTWQGVGGVKSIQRGTVTATNGTTTNVTVSAVTMGKAYVNFPNDLALPTTGAYSVEATLTSSTNIAISNTSPNNYPVAWELIEFY